MKTRLLLIALSWLVLVSFADAQTATTVAASPLPPTADYSAFGPFTTSTENNTGPDGTYTIVRPETLGKDGFLHAPIIFGPGIGGPVASMMNLLQRIASHGFVIIGRQLDAGPGNPENNMRLDWLLAQNTTAGSKFEGKLDVRRAAAMGYSVGGTAAVDIGAHKAITTVISIHGHSAKAELHGTLLLLGGTNDVMRDGQSWLAPTYEASQVQTFFSLVDGANHGYPARTVDGVQSGVEAPAMIAWLRYWIYNDQAAKRYFFGDDCVMCTSPWTKTQRKNWR
jgi:dienelactone hydrolase